MLKLKLLETIRKMDEVNYRPMAVEAVGDALVFTKAGVRLVVYDDDHFKVEVEELGAMRVWAVYCNEVTRWGWGTLLKEIEVDEVTGLPTWVVITHELS